MNRTNDVEFMNVLNVAGKGNLSAASKELLYELLCRNQELSARIDELEARLGV